MRARALSRLAVPILCLLLASCWTGPLFFSASELKAPIAPGDYRQETFGKPADARPDEIEESPVRVRILPSGLTRMGPVAKPDETLSYGFAALDGGHFIGWARPDESASAGEDVAYFLLDRDGAAYRLTIPVCEDEIKGVALAAGAALTTDPKVPGCRFSDRKSLETAMRRLAELPSGGVRLVPVPR